MKAVQLLKYRKINPLIKVDNQLPPAVTADQVLVKVGAAGINPVDRLIATGKLRPVLRLSLPHVLGFEFAGEITKIGPAVHHFRVGDRVFAMMPKERIGAEAEYVAISEKYLAPTPDYLSDTQAASVPLAALTAEQAYDLMNVQAGGTLFIPGGTGSVGALAIPLAKARGLRVIASGSQRNKERVMALGADRFLDYHTQDYTQILANIDYVLDTLGNREIPREIKVLKPGGKIVSLIGNVNRKFAQRWGASYLYTVAMGMLGYHFDHLASQHGGASYDFLFTLANGDQLRRVSQYLTRHEVPIQVGRLINIDEAPVAIMTTAHHHSNGKTVLKFT